jgi:hypothetical protein
MPSHRPPACLAILQDCLALGAILAATDSVAALQVISQDRFPLLYSVVFGEGVINDATSIVILGTIQARALQNNAACMDAWQHALNRTLRLLLLQHAPCCPHCLPAPNLLHPHRLLPPLPSACSPYPQKFGLDSSEDLTFGLVCIVLLDFCYLFIASALLGLAFGLVTAYCLRTFHFNHVSQARSAGQGGECPAVRCMQRSRGVNAAPSITSRRQAAQGRGGGCMQCSADCVWCCAADAPCRDSAWASLPSCWLLGAWLAGLPACLPAAPAP